MWIELDNTIIDYLNKVNNPRDIGIFALEQMFASMRKYQHIVFASRNILAALEDNVFFSRGTCDFIRVLGDHYTEIYSGLRNKIKHKIIVSPSQSQICRLGDNYLVPLQRMSDIYKSRLLVENESDGTLLLDISNYFLHKDNMDSWYGICFENNAYSGSGAGRKISELTKSDTIIICFVDSDKSFDKDQSGASSKGAKNEYKRHKDNHVIELYEYNVREKENLIPPSWYQAVSEDRNKLIEILCENLSEYWYFDVKDGIKLKKYKDSNWRRHYEEIVKKCIAANICKINEIEEPTENDIVIEGIGDKLVERVDVLLIAALGEDRYGKTIEERMKHFSLKMERREELINLRNNLYQSLPEHLQKEWNDIFQLMLSFGCSLDNAPGVLASEYA